jgi:hypothetical protein
LPRANRTHQGGDDRIHFFDGEVSAVDARLNQLREQIVAGLAASIGDHHVDVRVQVVKRFGSHGSPTGSVVVISPPRWFGMTSSIRLVVAQTIRHGA